MSVFFIYVRQQWINFNKLLIMSAVLAFFTCKDFTTVYLSHRNEVQTIVLTSDTVIYIIMLMITK